MTKAVPGRLLAFVGPSGVGKDSVMAALAAARPDFGLVRRVITRGGDKTGEPSIAVVEETFEVMAQRGDFILHWRAHGFRYGIPNTVKRELANGVTLLVNLSRSVLLEAQAHVERLTVIQLVAPPAILAARLAQRGRESSPAIEKRLARAGQELPSGLRDVLEVSNAGPLDETVEAILAQLQPESALR